MAKSLLMMTVSLQGRLRYDKFQGVVQSHCCQAPNTMLPIAKHRKGVSVLLACAKVCVAAVLGIT